MKGCDNMLAKIGFYWMIFWRGIEALIMYHVYNKGLRFRNARFYFDNKTVTSEDIQNHLDNHRVILIKSADGNVLVCHGTPRGRVLTSVGEISCFDDRFINAVPPGKYTGISCYPGAKYDVWLAGRSIVWGLGNAATPLITVSIFGNLYVYAMPEYEAKIYGFKISTDLVEK